MSIFDASSSLLPTFPAYRDALVRLVWGAFLEDSGHGDVTTRVFLGADASCAVTATVITREKGIFAGGPEAAWFLKKAGIKIVSSLKEGARLRAGQKIMVLRGSAGRLLAAERTLLNLLQRMSGVATATARLRLRLPSRVALLATRKTPWGLLDKRAVFAGGGLTHRLGLWDAVLVKDNHWALLPDAGAGVRRVLKTSPSVSFTEFEFKTLAALEAFVRRHRGVKKAAVMLDNFPRQSLAEAVQIAKKAGFWVEVSGGMGRGRGRIILPVGVDAVSSGAITHSAAALDFSLDLHAD